MTYRSRSQALSDETVKRLLAKHGELHALLKADGFVLDARGNPHPGSPSVYLDFHYKNPDGRSALIKFKTVTTEVLLTIRSPF